MIDRLNYRMSMFLRIKLFYKDEADDIAVDTPAILASKVRFNIALDNLQEQRSIFAKDTTGATDQKKVYKIELGENLLALSGSLSAYYRIMDNEEALKKVHLTKTIYKRKLDSQIHNVYDVLLTAAEEDADDIAAHNINTRLPEVAAAFNKFNTYLSVPQDNRYRKAEARKKAVECDAIVNNEVKILAAIMQSLPEKFSAQKGLFEIIHGITDTPRARRKPDAKLLIGPGKFLVILTLEYLAGRYFKLTNLGKDAILWGLSTIETGFSNKSFALDAGKKSIRLSRALGAEGDFLVVHNPTDKTVEVALWADF